MIRKLILAVKVFVRILQWNVYYNYDEISRTTMLMFKNL